MYQQEVWKDVVGFERVYQVSSLGRVKSLARENRYYREDIGKECVRRYPDRIMKVKFGTRGYYVAHLRNGADIESWPNVHRLVAEAFIPNIHNKPSVNHKDGNKKNNCVENLEWATYSENTQHAYDMGLAKSNGGNPPKCEDSPNARLKNSDIFIIIEKRNAGNTLKSIADEYDVGISTIHRICNKLSWKSLHD